MFGVSVDAKLSTTVRSALSRWIQSQMLWILWGTALGFGVGLMHGLGKLHADQNPLDGVAAAFVSAVGLLVGLLALILKFVFMSRKNIWKDWPVVILFPCCVLGSTAFAYFSLMLAAKLFRIPFWTGY